jgi:limonene-1,2-epoxide hydrolase
MSSDAATTDRTSVSPPRQVVEDFLAACVAADFDAIPGLLAPDVVYHNVGLPVIHGRSGATKFLRLLFGRPGTRFGVVVHRIVQEGDVVLTERTDVSVIGRMRVQFWVCGTFEVHDNQITLWRDYFDWYDIAKGFVRGVLGVLIPAGARSLR